MSFSSGFVEFESVLPSIRLAGSDRSVYSEELLGDAHVAAPLREPSVGIPHSLPKYNSLVGKTSEDPFRDALCLVTEQTPRDKMFADTMVAQDGNNSPKTEDLASISEVPGDATGMFG